MSRVSDFRERLLSMLVKWAVRVLWRSVMVVSKVCRAWRLLKKVGIGSRLVAAMDSYKNGATF